MALYDIPFTAEDRANLQAAADKEGMTVIEFLRWAGIIRVAEVLGGGDRTVDHPFGAPAPSDVVDDWKKGGGR